MKKFFEMLNTINLYGIIAIAVLVVALLIIFRKAVIYYLKELVAMYSNSETYFSKKRIESGIAFLFALCFTIWYVNRKIDQMDIYDFGYILTVWLFIAGYTVNMIQKEKNNQPPKP